MKIQVCEKREKTGEYTLPSSLFPNSPHVVVLIALRELCYVTPLCLFLYQFERKCKKRKRKDKEEMRGKSTKEKEKEKEKKEKSAVQYCVHFII
jgi:hypothetical protein